MKKEIKILVLPLILSLTITGCSFQGLLGNKKKSSQKTTQEQKQVIAVALNEEDPNRLLIQKGIEDMAKKENMEIKLISKTQGQGEGQGQNGKSSSSGNSSQGQKSGNSSGQKSESPLKDAKVLIYQGGNQQVLQAAQEEKVPVLAISALPSGIKPAGVVLPDPEKTGELMAETLLSRLGEGNVVILQGDPSATSSQEILAANRRVLNKNPKLTVHVISSPAGSESVAKQNLIDYLQKNPGKIQGLIAHTEKLAAQGTEVLKQLGLDKKVVFVSGQANLESLQRLAAGTQQGDIDTSPYILGVNAFQWATKVVKKESMDINKSLTSEQGEIPAKVVPVKLVTPENVAMTQKTYSTTIEMAKQEQEQAQSKEKQGSEGQKDKKDQKDKSQASNQEGKSGEQNKQGESKPAGNMPQGVSKVTERVKTETTREYLDAQGKVIGTEKSANEQVRTIPPEMLKAQGQAEQKPDEKDKKKEDKSGGGEGKGKE